MLVHAARELFAEKPLHLPHRQRGHRSQFVARQRSLEVRFHGFQHRQQPVVADA